MYCVSGGGYRRVRIATFGTDSIRVKLDTCLGVYWKRNGTLTRSKIDYFIDLLLLNYYKSCHILERV